MDWFIVFVLSLIAHELLGEYYALSALIPFSYLVYLVMKWSKDDNH